MSMLTDNWNTLYAVQTESIGTSPVVALAGGVSGVPCIAPVDDASFTFGLGGQTGTGQNEISTLTAAWTGGIPVKGDMLTITALPGSRTVALQVISTNEKSGILYITIGDNSNG